MVEIMGAFFNIVMSLGVTWNMVERVSDACEPTYNAETSIPLPPVYRSSR